MADEGARIKRTPSTPYGSVQRANAAARAAQRPAPGQAAPPPSVPAGPPAQDLTPRDEIEQALFGPTRLPNQPITAGAPIGPGAMTTATLSDREAAINALQQLTANPDAPEEVRRLLSKMERGA